MVLNLPVIFLLLAAVLNLVDGEWRTNYDYCNPELCSAGKNHIACNNTGAIQSKCGMDLVYLVPMHSKRKLYILQLHNELRGKIARGEVTPYSQASRMPVLSWDDELEYLASLHVKRCTLAHDECRNTVSFNYVGQNVGIRETTGDLEKFPKTIKRIVMAWFAEHENGNQTFINTYKPHPEKKRLGHFTVLAADRAVKMGCSCILFFDKTNKKKSFMMTCNYSAMNLLNEPVYATGNMTSECKSGNSSRYPGLCSFRERNLIDPMTGLLER